MVFDKNIFLKLLDEETSLFVWSAMTRAVLAALLLAGACCLGNGGAVRDMHYEQEHVIAPAGSDSRFAETAASKSAAPGASPGAVPMGGASGSVRINKDVKGVYGV